VSFARVVLIERKGKFKVNLAHFVAEVKGIETRGHKGKVAVKSLAEKWDVLLLYLYNIHLQST
jgi:hypothetical protein